MALLALEAREEPSRLCALLHTSCVFSGAMARTRSPCTGGANRHYGLWTSRWPMGRGDGWSPPTSFCDTESSTKCAARGCVDRLRRLEAGKLGPSLVDHDTIGIPAPGDGSLYVASLLAKSHAMCAPVHVHRYICTLPMYIPTHCARVRRYFLAQISSGQEGGPIVFVHMSQRTEVTSCHLMH
jgi:hypothetical protein